MKLISYFLACVAGAAVAAAVLLWVPNLGHKKADDDKALAAAVAQYIAQHPEAIGKALQQLQDNAQAETNAQMQAALKDHAQDLDHDPADLVLGNPAGDVTLVEFFDYRCPYCKRAFQTVTDAVKADGHVRLVLKEFPILGPDSQLAARAALASARQGKYAPFHSALLASPAALNEVSIMAIAKLQGIDLKRLAADMKAPEVDAIISKNFALAQTLHIEGTPAFVIGGEMVPGAVDRAALDKLVADARKKAG